MHYAPRFRLFILLSVLSFAIYGQYTKPVPEWVKPVGVHGLSMVKKNQVQDGYYYVLIDEQYHVPKRQNFFHYAVCAFTEEALTTISQIEFRFDPSYQTAHLHRLVIHRDGRSIDRTKEVKLTELIEEREREEGILSGKKTLFCNLPDIRKNDIVEYSYSIQGVNPVMKTHFQYDLETSFSVPIGRISHRILFPNNVTPHLVYQKTDKKPTITKGDLTEYSWTYDDPRVITSDNSVPDWYSAYGSVQVTSFTNWDDVKKHCGGFFKLESFDRSDLQAVVDSIKQQSLDIERQVTAVVQFVQTEVRYSGNENGIYSHVPRNPATVLRNRFGDCKEKTVLLNELLGMLGIKSYPALINTTLRGKVVQSAPAVGAFNHVITAFEYGGSLHFIDPTISYQRGSFLLRTVPDYQVAFILNREGESFTQIPTNKDARTEVLEALTIDESGDAQLEVTTHYYGSSADDTRYEYLVNSTDQIQESYRKFYTRINPKVVVLDSIQHTDNEEKNEYIIKEKYALPGFWKASDSSSSKDISKDFMPFSLHARLNFGEEDNRKDPLKIFYPLNYSHTLTVTKTHGWNVADETKTEKNKFFDYSFVRKVNGDKLSLIYDYTSNTEVIDPLEYLAYKEKMDFINYNMVFSATEQYLAPGTLSFNWPLLLSLFLGLGAGVLMILNLRFKSTQVFEKRYDSIGGWLFVLAISLIIGPFRLAIGVFQSCKTEMGVNYLVYYFDEKSPYFSPLTGFYNFFIEFGNTFFVAMSVYIAFLFFQKRKSFRPFFTLFKISNCAFLVINVIVVSILYSDSQVEAERALLSKEIKTMATVLIGTALWVPYILYSQRSCGTFVNEPEQENIVEENLTKAISVENENNMQDTPASIG